MKNKNPIGLNDPLYHACHAKPVTRRDFIAQGFMAGMGTVLSGSVLSLFANPGKAHATLSADLEALKSSCGIATQGAGKIPFIVFDLAGGANINSLNIIYNLADVLNKIIFGMIIYSAALEDTKKSNKN